MNILRPLLSMATIASALVGLPGAASAQTPVERVSVRAVASFGFNQIVMSERDRAHLLAEVGTMKDVSWQTVQAVGHTDSVGPDGYNQRLSQRRAEAVKTYLISQGLMSEMVRAEGRASSVPVASNATATGRAKNRRAEVEFLGVRTASR